MNAKSKGRKVTYLCTSLSLCSLWGKLVTVKRSSNPSIFVFKMDDRSLWESILHYGLFLGGIFQLICILAIVIVPSDNSVDDEGILLNKEEKLRKFQGQQTLHSQTRLRERRKKKWHCCYYIWVSLTFSRFFLESSPGLKKKESSFHNLLIFRWWYFGCWNMMSLNVQS